MKGICLLDFCMKKAPSCSWGLFSFFSPLAHHREVVYVILLCLDVIVVYTNVMVFGFELDQFSLSLCFLPPL